MSYLGTGPVIGLLDTQPLSVNGVDVSFSLNYTTSSSTSILVIIDGKLKQPIIDYIITGSGNTLLFSSPPTAVTSAYIIYLAKSISVPRTPDYEISRDSFTGTGSQTDFTLSKTPIDDGTIVFVSGVKQVPTTQYTLSGNTLHFISAPGNATIIEVYNLGKESIVGETTSLKKINNLSDVTTRQTALNNLTAVSAATNEYILTKDTSSGDAIWKASVSGSVTSVALSSGSTGLSVSGSPITTSGTFSLSWSSQTAKFVLAAPNGSSGTPTWRQLQASDLSDLGTAATKNTGTSSGTVATGDDSRITGALQSTNNLSDTGNRQTSLNNLTAVSAATNEFVLTKDTSTGNALWKSVSGTGTVTSVTVSSGNSYISSSGSPITSSGTITLTANIGTTSNTIAAGDDSRITGAAQKSSNLSDLSNKQTSLNNLSVVSGATNEFVLTKDTSSGNLIFSEPFTNYKNRLLNPWFDVDQRVNSTTPRSDGDYCLDGWYVLTQTGNINVTQQSLQENGQAKNIRLTQSQATAQRIGLCQIINAIDCQDLRNQVCSALSRIRCSSSQAIRYAIVEWTGSENAPTKDIVNSWTNSTYTTGNFFISSNITVRVVGSKTPTANTWTWADVISGTIGTNINNIYFFVWTEGTLAQNETLDIGLAQFGKSVIATFIDKIKFSTQLEDCKFFFRKSYAYTTAVATNTSPGYLEANSVITLNGSSTNERAVNFSWSMRASPTITFYSYTNSTSGKWEDGGGVTKNMASSVNSSGGVFYNNEGISTNTVLFGHYIASAELGT